MPKKQRFPKPAKRFVSGAWVILWRFSPEPGKYKQYTVSTGLTQEKEDQQHADIILRLFAVALAQDPPIFPKDFVHAPGVIRYLEDRTEQGKHGNERQQPALPPEKWIEAYEPVIKKECAQNWSVTSIAFIKALAASVPEGIGSINSFHANRFLEGILATRKPATRNRALAACSRFFNWCKASGLVTENPFAGVKALREVDIESIVYCTRSERSRILNIAKSLGRNDWIAVPIAFYAGCRREEIYNLEWRDINLESKRMVIRKTKTMKKRITFIATELKTILEPLKKERGFVVPRSTDETWQNQADRLVEMIRECLCLPESPNVNGRAAESIGKRQFFMTQDLLEKALKTRKKELAEVQGKFELLERDDKLHYETALALVRLENCPVKATDGQDLLPAERIGWNTFRHTFATTLVQAGVSIEKVAKWMGNSIKVCETHYAEFIPRDKFDEDIDKL